MSEEDAQILKKAYVRTRKYINNEVDFEPFKSQEGYEVSKALLLFLLRPKYTDLLSWPYSETGASEEILLTALAFSGIVAGRKSMNVKYRNREFEQFLTESLLDGLKKKKESKAKPLKGSVKKGSTRKDQDIIELISQPAGENVKSVEARLSELAYPELNSVLRNEAIDLCMKLNWYDCLVTRIELTEHNEICILPNSRDHKIELIIKGPVISKVEIETELYRQRIMDPALKKQVMAALDDT